MNSVRCKLDVSDPQKKKLTMCLCFYTRICRSHPSSCPVSFPTKGQPNIFRKQIEMIISNCSDEKDKNNVATYLFPSVYVVVNQCHDL